MEVCAILAMISAFTCFADSTAYYFIRNTTPNIPLPLDISLRDSATWDLRALTSDRIQFRVERANDMAYGPDTIPAGTNTVVCFVDSTEPEYYQNCAILQKCFYAASLEKESSLFWELF